MSATPARVALPIAAGVPPSPIPFWPAGIRDSAAGFNDHADGAHRESVGGYG